MKIRFPFVKIPFIQRLNEEVIYRMLNLFLISGSGLFLVGNHLGIQSFDVVSILEIVLFLLGVSCFRQSRLQGRIFIIIGLVVVLFAIGISVGFQNYVSFIESYFQWASNKPSWESEWIRGYESIQILVLVGISLGLHCLIEKNFRIKISFSVLLLAALFYRLLTEKSLAHLGVIFVFLYVLIVCVEVIQRRWEKVKSKKLASYIVWMSPFFTIYFILLMCMPVSEKPYDWQIVKTIYHEVQESFKIISQKFLYGPGGEYEFSFSDFSEKGGIGGSIFQKERDVMTIESEYELKTNIYMIGKIFDTFDGRAWLQRNEVTNEARFIDTIETMYAVERYDMQYMKDYLSSVKMKVCYKDLRSGYIFAPLKISEIQKDGDNLYHNTSGGNILFEEVEGYGTEYEVSFYQMNMGQNVFMDFLETESEPDEKILQKLLYNLNGWIDERISVEDLENYKKSIEQYYIGEIELSEDVRTYLDEIIKDADTDAEKLTAIEKELASFEYTQKPGDLPDSVTNGKEFLDYFLLKSKKGYCNYFATAFVLLARAEGIPARFVQGFCVPMYGKEEVIVSSNMAHAWPEVYLNDIGWIPFEPTPGYAQIRYTPWQTVNKAEGGNAYGNGFAYQGSENDRNVMSENNDGERLGTTNKKSTLDYIKEVGGIIVMATILFFIFAIAILLIYQMIFIYRYKKSDVQGRCKIEIERIFRILMLLRIKKDDIETIEEFSRRVNEELNLEGTFSFWEEYEAFVYGDKLADIKMLQIIIEDKEILLQILKERCKIRYWIERCRRIV